MEPNVQIASLGNGPVLNSGVARRDAPSSADPTAAQTPVIKYQTPTLKYDPQSRLVIFQVLNPETGDVVRQYPSQRVVKLYQDGSDLATNPEVIDPIPGIDPNAGKPKAASSSSTGNSSGSGQPAPSAAPSRGEGAARSSDQPSASSSDSAPSGGAPQGGSLKIEA